MLPDSGAGLRLRGVSTQPGQRKDGETPLNEGVGQRKEIERKRKREGRKAKGKMEGRNQERKEKKFQLILSTTQVQAHWDTGIAPALWLRGPHCLNPHASSAGGTGGPGDSPQQARGQPLGVALCPAAWCLPLRGLLESPHIRAWAPAGVILFPKDWLSWQRSSWYY